VVFGAAAHPPTRVLRPKATATARKGSPCEGEGGVRVNPGRDRGVRGSITSAPWAEQAHAHDEGREAGIMRVTCSMSIRRSGLRAS